jgi:transposase
VAPELRVSRQAVSVWARELEEVNGAVGKLKARLLERPKPLDTEQRAVLSRLLVRGALQAGFTTELWTVKLVCSVISRVLSLEYNQPGCWELLSDMGFSPPKRKLRATQRNEPAISEWKAKTWPALKAKEPSARAEPSSSWARWTFPRSAR